VDTHIIEEIRAQVAQDIHLVPTNGHLRIGTPLIFDDGDRCSFFLVKKDSGWALTDLGDILTRAGYVEADLLEPGYRSRFDRLMQFFGMREESGQIVMPIRDDGYADAIFTFTQGALELVKLASTPPERERKSEKPFQDTVSRLVRDLIPVDCVDEKWHDPEHDPEKFYPIDYRVRGKDDVWWYLFGISTIPKCLHAAISCYHYTVKQARFRGLAIYKDKESLGKRTTSPLDEVATTFSVNTQEESLRSFIQSDVRAA
jgi:hypothetical protein